MVLSVDKSNETEGERENSFPSIEQKRFALDVLNEKNDVDDESEQVSRKQRWGDWETS